MSLEDESPLVGAKPATNSVGFKGHAFRYFGLFFICLMTLGSYYIYDIPAALQAQIEYLYSIDAVEWNLLYSVYSFPNMIIVFFGGYLIDNVFGLKKGAIIFCCLIFGGQAIFALSSNLKLFWLALVGRTIFGLGGESLGVAQSTFCATWFKGRGDINLAFAITLAFSRIGSAINFQISPMVYCHTHYSVSTAVWVGAIICGISFASCIILVVLDIIRGKKDKDEVAPSTVQSFSEIISSFKDVFKFPGTLWLINLSVVLFYVPLFIFVSISSNFFESKYGLTQTEATSLSSIPYYAAISSPIVGFIVDRTGHNVYYTLFSSMLLMTSHALYAFSDVNAWVPTIFLGVSYAFMAASIWVTIPCLIPSKSLGTAYGLAFACQNAAIASFGLIINAVIAKYNTNPVPGNGSSGDINPSSTCSGKTSDGPPQFASANAYHIAELIFFGLTCLCFLTQLTIIAVDKKNGWINVSSARMKQRVRDLNPEDEKESLIN